MNVAPPCVFRIAGLLLLAVLPLATIGCAQGPNPDLAGPSYPEIQQGQTLDIQVVRDVTIVRLTNTTAMSFGPSRLWVNRWYSKGIEKLDVGQTLELSLWDFRDEHGEPFHAGGFFAIKRPDPLVQAQLETDGQILGLVVVSTGEE
jgi:hypothetical protein